MGRNWAITIGINQYHNLQRLHFAQQDAESMRDFFLREIGFEQVYHFTNDSAPIQPDSGPLIVSQPTYGTLKRFLRVRFERPCLQAGDNFWFFFAGHGLFHEGHDYLMPIDADPGNVEETAIPVQSITERLRGCGADNVVLFLDACRNRDRAGRGMGSELPQGVITFFSCNPQERSYEIETLHHGTFTYALLEGLRIQGAGNCATVERLDQYLRYQVPQLNHRHGKPRQTPYTCIEPIVKQHLILLPQQATLLADVMALKNDAFEAEAEGQLQLAEQFWIRVLTVSPADQQAINAIKRLARKLPLPPGAAQTTPPASQPNPGRSSNPAPAVPPQQSSPARPSPSPAAPPQRPSQRTPAPTAPPSPPVKPPAAKPQPTVRRSRRRFLQIAAGAGGAVALGWAISRFSTNPSSGDWGEEVATDFFFDVVTIDERSNETHRRQGKATGFAQPLGKDVRLEMVSIPGGSFTMGSPENELERYEHEGPQHQVAVPAFSMGKYQVTQAQWQAVATLPQIERELNPNPSRFKGNDRPVERVSWLDAVEFCARLSQKSGRQYRLPSEAEWEYACRAGTKTPFHFGGTINIDLANYRGTDLTIGNTTYSGAYGKGLKGKYRQETMPVGHFKVANAFGLYDMHGNVWEWCTDSWHEDYQGAPTDGSAWIFSIESNFKVRRGGSWFNFPRSCRSASRVRYGHDYASRDVGFRVVCAAPRSS